MCADAFHKRRGQKQFRFTVKENINRFARIFQEQEPAAEIWGLDISEEMLRFVPAGIHTRVQSQSGRDKLVRSFQSWIGHFRAT